MKKTFFIILGVGLLAALDSSCGSRKQGTAQKSPDQDVPPETSCAPVSYAGSLDAIIGVQCGRACHSAAKKAGGIDLSTYEMVKMEASKPRFLGAIKHEQPFSPMPKKAPKLSDSAIAVVKCWIESGMYP